MRRVDMVKKDIRAERKILRAAKDNMLWENKLFRRTDDVFL